MATYAELDSIVGQLKRACIDAYMVRSDWYISEDRYHIRNSSLDTDIFGRHPDVPPVYRPDATGAGGGSPTCWGRDEQDFTVDFQEIRDRVDDIVARWFDLPDPDPIRTEVGAFGDVCEGLRPSTAVVDVNGMPTIAVAGLLGETLDNINQDAGDLSGATARAFKDEFLRRMPDVLAGHCAIATVLTYALASEVALWEKARQDVADAVDKAREAAEAIVAGQPVDWTMVLTVVGWAAAVAGILTSAGVSAIVTGSVGLGVDVLTQAAEEHTVTGGAHSHTEVLDSLEETLDAINSAIVDAESDVHTCLSDNHSIVLDHREAFDLSQPAIESLPDDGSPLTINAASMRAIIDSYLPTASEELRLLASDSLACSFRVLRDASIGWGPEGPTRPWYLLRLQLCEFLLDLAEEADLDAANLNAALAAFGAADDASRAALEETASAIQGHQLYPDPPARQPPGGPDAMV